jgi:hypothetical protein
VTEQVGSSVKLPIFIREVTVSNLGRNTGYADSDFYILQSFQENYLKLGHGRLIPNHLAIRRYAV